MSTIAFLGAGNIAQAIMGGLLKDNQSETPGSTRITAYDPVDVCRERAAELGAEVRSSNEDAIGDADIVMLCVKPNILIELLQALAPSCRSGQLFISVAAGVTAASMQAVMPQGAAIVRCMPNTPALVKTGMTGMFATKGVTADQRSSAESVLAAVGETVWVRDENQLDAVTAVSGSGPAYYFLMMEAMINAGVEAGLDPDTAKQLVLQTALGAATMAKASADDPGTLRVNVTSPGGTTQAALEYFESQGLNRTVAGAVNAAKVRSIELSREFG